jgi:hypothetical protein
MCRLLSLILVSEPATTKRTLPARSLLPYDRRGDAQCQIDMRERGPRSESSLGYRVWLLRMCLKTKTLATRNLMRANSQHSSLFQTLHSTPNWFSCNWSRWMYLNYLFPCHWSPLMFTYSPLFHDWSPKRVRIYTAFSAPLRASR